MTRPRIIKYHVASIDGRLALSQLFAIGVGAGPDIRELHKPEATLTGADSMWPLAAFPRPPARCSVNGELLAASGANVDARDETQSTLLMYFARRGNAEPMQWLLAHGADRNARNKSGKTAAEVGRAHAAIVRMLVR